MEFEKRIDLLIQSANLAQENGILTLDDAVVVKSAINNINNKVDMEQSVALLVKIAQTVQKKGIFTLKDAFYMFMALDGIEDELKKFNSDPDVKEETEKGEE